MFSGQFVLSQILDFIHPQQFHRCVTRYGGDYKIQHFSCWQQFVCLVFAQLTWRESLRDIEACLNARAGQLYHLGLRAPVKRSTLADALATRDWRIFAQLAQHLVGLLYQQRWQVELFFRWLKQHLRIKAFYGTSANAVRSQLWVAVCVYALVAILKKRLGSDATLYEILQILSVSVFEKTPVAELFQALHSQNETSPLSNQLLLFE
jgi:hypothetical protein